MTQEEKAARYDEAIRIAKEINNEQRSQPFNVMTRVFPELTESEDEKTIKLCKELVESTYQYGFCNKEERDNCINWLEKQGEDKKEINNFDVLPGLYKCVHRMFDETPDGKLLFEVGNIYKCLSKHDRAEFEVSYGHSVYLEDPVVCKHFIPFEKQSEQKPTDKVEPKDYSSIDPHFFKPVDKVEPKYHEGDWVVRGKTVAQILDIQEQYYVGLDIDGNDFTSSRFLSDDKIHLWTINDARDGDVLVSECNQPFIYNGHFDTSNVGAYCGLDCMGKDFIITDDLCNCNWTYNNNIKPATKEQRNILFAEMKEAGYEWDSEKKELKKIHNALEDCEIENIEHGKYYYCIKDYYSGGNKRASKGDVVQALRGMSMMALGVKANEYFIPVNAIKQENSNWSDEDENVLEAITYTVKYSGYKQCIGVSSEAMIDWLKSLKEKVLPQQKQEWGDEDTKNWQGIIDEIKANKSEAPDYDIKTYDGYLSWLQQLKYRIK